MLEAEREHLAEALERVFAATHLTRPADVATVLAREATRLGAEDLVLYLVDYTQEVLLPLAAEDRPERAPQSVDGTMAGRTYATAAVLQAPVPDDPARVRVWLPLLDGTDRIGVLETTVAVAADGVARDQLAALEGYAHASAMLLVSKQPYGDTFELVRRRRPMSLSAELLWRLLPPLTFATDGFVITGLVEPADEIGGDAFDYAVNDAVAHVAVFDAMGHGLSAALLTSLALSAYRHSRIAGEDLTATYRSLHEALAAGSGGERYVTALLLQLDLDSGRLRWLSAGHPPPLLLRSGRVVKTLEVPPCLPLGMPFAGPPAEVAEEQLEPGDQVLLYTDGFPEARLPDGDLFGLDRLSEFIEHEAAAARPAPETLRRLRRSLLGERQSSLRDDATVVLLAWRGEAERALLPQTVD